MIWGCKILRFHSDCGSPYWLDLNQTISLSKWNRIYSKIGHIINNIENHITHITEQPQQFGYKLLRPQRYCNFSALICLSRENMRIIHLLDMLVKPIKTKIDVTRNLTYRGSCETIKIQQHIRFHQSSWKLINHGSHI